MSQPESGVVFALTPVAKPRMTQADKWKQRPAVLRYWDFKDELRSQAMRQGFTLGEAFRVTFYLPMPQSWSKRKRAKMAGTKHQGRPDLDNLEKAVADSLAPENDSYIWHKVSYKVWASEGRIVIENIAESRGY